MLGRWIGEREHRNPGAVYEAAIQERIGQYAKLREAAAGVIYMRQKLEKELAQRSEELGRVRRQLDVAVEKDTPSYLYNGKMFYFCSPTCAKHFQQDPAKYVNDK